MALKEINQCWWRKSSLKPHTREMTKIGQAARLCGSLPLGCIITYLEIHLIPHSIRCCPIREMVADPNSWWYTFDTLKRNEWSVMCGPDCKMFLLNPVYSPLEIHYRKVVPYLVMSEIQSPISTTRFSILYYIWSVRCKRSARFYLFDVDIMIISPDFDIKIFWLS